MPKSGARLPKSEATRAKLLECAAVEVLESGPDQVGFTAIARRAQMSTGALYARYENVDELLLELWLMKGLPTLRDLVGDMEESLAGDNARQARRRVADRLGAPDPALALVVNLMVVARRNEAMGEFVVPSVAGALQGAMTRTPAFDFYLGQVLGIALGVRGTGMHGHDWYPAVSIVASSVRDATDVVPIAPDARAVPETAGEGPEIDEMDKRLFDAVSRVISRVGVDKATISRIARHADVNPASIYLRYADKDALLSACIAHLMASTYGENDRLVTNYSGTTDTQAGQGADRYGVVMFRGNQSDDNHETRRLRLETLFASTHHEHLRTMTRRVFDEILAHDEGQLGAPKGAITASGNLPYLVFNRFAFFGNALLREYGYLAPDHPRLVSFIGQMGSRLFGASVAMRQTMNQK